ncbi:two-component system sensor histidine kinase NtrB [Rhizobium mayense]|uniref:histidine kinase n=1 Tax=Rhizobium mayense TaxID=1312184 RepID=A0ABT7K467_9HYPH|nr:ATP-binding protein [Rhizobium mayense]MDL2403405.1 ATP-binding protein [Rhizobium mayense]
MATGDFLFGASESTVSFDATPTRDPLSKRMASVHEQEVDMQDADGRRATAPCSKAAPVVEVHPRNMVVLADGAGVVIGQGRLFAASVGSRPRGAQRRTAPALRCVDIPLVGPNGEVSGILRRVLPVAEFGALSAQLESASHGSEDELTKSVAHDMNNLLAVIDGGLGLLEHQSDADARKAIFTRLHGAVDRGAILTRMLLNHGSLARRGCSGTTPRQLSVAIEDLRPSLSPDTLMEIEIEAGLWAVKADPDELYFALLNLCRNADAAMPEGGLIVVSAANITPQLDSGYGGMVAMTVRDNGSGISEEVMGRIFEPYFTTKEVGAGTGLGLAQVRAFVERQGGWIELQSELGFGTAIRMIFPRVPDAEFAVPVREPNSDESCSHAAPSTISYSPSPNGGVFHVVPSGGQRPCLEGHLRGPIDRCGECLWEA